MRSIVVGWGAAPSGSCGRAGAAPGLTVPDRVSVPSRASPPPLHRQLPLPAFVYGSPLLQPYEVHAVPGPGRPL